MSNEDEYDLRAAWEKACQSFATTTKIDLLQGKVNSPEEVISQLKLKRQEDEEKKAEFKVLKDVLGKSLVFIQNLGGIAAQGAGMVRIFSLSSRNIMNWAYGEFAIGLWSQYLVLQCCLVFDFGWTELQEHLHQLDQSL